MIKNERFARVEAACIDKFWTRPGINRLDLLNPRIAHGRIDGIARVLDNCRTMPSGSPRKTLAWANSHRDRAARPASARRKHTAGLAAYRHFVLRRAAIPRTAEDRAKEDASVADAALNQKGPQF